MPISKFYRKFNYRLHELSEKWLNIFCRVFGGHGCMFTNVVELLHEGIVLEVN